MRLCKEYFSSVLGLLLHFAMKWHKKELFYVFYSKIIHFYFASAWTFLRANSQNNCTDFDRTEDMRPISDIKCSKFCYTNAFSIFIILLCKGWYHSKDLYSVHLTDRKRKIRNYTKFFAKYISIAFAQTMQTKGIVSAVLVFY